MAGGIHVEVTIGDPTTCQVAPHSDGEATVTSVTKSPHPEKEQQLVEEFTLSAGPKGVEPDGGMALDTDIVQRLFTAGPAEIYRFERETPQGCVCEQVEEMGCPIREVNATDGRLHVRFIAPDHDSLQSVLERLADVYDEMCVDRLLHSTERNETEQLTLVDIHALTDRQREVMQVAHRMGYFEHPKTASAADVAERLGISPSTFTEHLAAAQRNLFDEILDR